MMIVAGGFMLLAAISLYYYIYNPTQNSVFFPSCPFKESTGLDCAGCGGQRAVHALLHGDIIGAIDYNLLFVFILPLIMYYTFYSIKRYIYGTLPPRNFLYRHKFGIFLIIFIVAFLILRNLPFIIFSWMNSSV
ncbi:MAG: DUF2752 domain-containing protein [Weeksellaceae bacterium]